MVYLNAWKTKFCGNCRIRATKLKGNTMELDSSWTSRELTLEIR